MDFIKFHGHKKTSDDFLLKIKGISKSSSDIIENLKSLNLFNSITLDKKKIFLEENSNSAKIKMSSSGKKNFNIFLPNILGSGETLNLNFKDTKDWLVEVAKPIVANKSLYKTKTALSCSKKSINEKNIESIKSEISIKRGITELKAGIEKLQNLSISYGGLDTNILGLNLRTKFGSTKFENNEPFLKAMISKSINFSTKYIFFDSNISIGRIFGKTPLTEKFFLGSRTRGYKSMSISPVSQNKKVGGNSFIEIRNRIGIYVKQLEVFGFSDLGINSYKGLRDCCDLAYKMSDSCCLGKSVGFGISLKNRPGVSFIYSIPLSSGTEFEKYNFSVDMEF